MVKVCMEFKAVLILKIKAEKFQRRFRTGILLGNVVKYLKIITSYSGYIDWICTSAGNNLHSSEKI